MAKPIEDIVPCMVPHQVEQNRNDFNLISIPPAGGKSVTVTIPNEYRFIYEGFRVGKTLRQTTAQLLAQKRFVGFRATVKTLDLLCLGQIIENHQEFEVYLDQLRSPYRWQESWIKTDFFHVAITPPLTIRWAHWSLGIMAGVFLISWLLHWATPKLIILLLMPQKIPSQPLITCALFYVFSSLLLSLKGFVRSFLTLLTHGCIPPLQIRMNFLGCYLDECPVRTAYTESNAFANGIILVISGPLLICGLALLQRFIPDLFSQVPVYFLLGLLILVEWSPFVHSNLTELLSQLYNWPTNSARRGLRDQFDFWNRHRDTLIYFVHWGATLLWISTLAVALAFVVSAVTAILGNADLGVKSFFSERLQMTLLFWVVVLFLVGDMNLGLNYTGPRQSFRRYWYRWRRRSLVAPKNDKTPFEILSEFPLFSEIKPEVRKVIAERARLVHIPPDQTLCRTGEKSRDLYLILSGAVGVFRRNGLGKYSAALELRSGSVVGEVGFFSGVPRTADVVSLEPTSLLKIEHSLETENLVLAQERFEFVKDRIWLMQTLASTSLFFRVPFEALQLIVQLGRVRNWPVGQRIATQGQEGNSCYIIIQGEVSVEVDGKPRPHLHRGDIMGEISLLFGSPRTATLTTVAETKVLEISREEFWHLLVTHLSLGLFVERVALQRLKRDIEHSDL